MFILLVPPSPIISCSPPPQQLNNLSCFSLLYHLCRFLSLCHPASSQLFHSFAFPLHLSLPVCSHSVFFLDSFYHSSGVNLLLLRQPLSSSLFPVSFLLRFSCFRTLGIVFSVSSLPMFCLKPSHVLSQAFPCSVSSLQTRVVPSSLFSFTFTAPSFLAQLFHLPPIRPGWVRLNLLALLFSFLLHLCVMIHVPVQ